MTSAASTARTKMSRVATVLSVSRAKRAIRPGRPAAGIFRGDLGSTGKRSFRYVVGARLNQERSDEYAADRQFGEAVHHDVVDRCGSRPKGLASIKKATQIKSKL